MIVFIEYVLLDNFIIDYLMLKATFNLTGITVKKRRLFLSAFLGAIIALIYPIMQSLGVLSTLIKILTGLLIVLVAGKFNSKKAFYINVVIFFVYTFITGGVILGIFSLFEIPTSTEISVALMVIPVYFALKGLNEVVKYFFSRKTVANYTYKVKLVMYDNSLIFNAFLDTGNGLTDNGEPVIVCDKKVVTKLLGKNITKVKLKKLNVITATGQSQNLAFKLDKLILYIDDKENTFNNVSVCVSKQPLGADFDIILHPKFMESDYANKTDIILKKSS